MSLDLELAEIRRRFDQLVRGLAADEITNRVDPAKWSIAECLEHLNKTAAVMQPLIEAAIQRGKEGKVVGAGPFKLGMMGGLLKWIAEPPPKFRMRAPKGI